MDITCPNCQSLYQNLSEKIVNRSFHCNNCNHSFIAVETLTPEETVLAKQALSDNQPSLVQETQVASTEHYSPPAPAPSASPLDKHLSFSHETQLASPESLPVEQHHTGRGNEQQKLSSAPSTISTIIGLGSEHFSSDLDLSELKVHDWQMGEVLLELYEVKRLLGEGQFGKVFQVRHRDWNIDLAVKTPKQKALLAGSDNTVKEAETWVNLDLHPNIVNCYYVRQIDEIPQIFSEYVDGGDLKQLIASQKLYQDGEHNALLKVLDISIQFAWGLDYAHEQGLIHQDIKPANIMITSDNVIKVTDFGLAKAGLMADISDQNNKQTIIIDGMGMTPAYASPEQLAGGRLTRRTDLWSWAVCVLEMLLGYCSWESGTIAPAILEAYKDKLLDDKPAISSIPETLFKLLEQCFQEIESARPVSLSRVADSLLDIYHNESGDEYPKVQPQEGSGTASSLNNQAISLIDLGKEAEAIKSWKHALYIDSQHFETNYNFLIFKWKNQGLEEVELLSKIESFYENHYRQNSKINDADAKRIVYALAKLYIQFGHYTNAIKILNDDQQKLTQLPSDLSNEGYKLLGLALCANNRLAKKTSKWLMTAECLKKSVMNKVIDPYSITAYSLALHRSGQTRIASLFFKSSQSMGIIPGQLKQSVALFLPGYEVLCRISKKHINVSKFINNGEKILFNQANDLLVWDLKEKQVTHKMKGHLSQITAFDVTLDETIVVTGSEQGDIRVWDIITGRLLSVWTAHKETINAVQISPCGQFLYSASNDNTLCKWDFHKKMQINSFYGEGHSNAINDIQLASSGTQLISASADNSLRLWDTDTGRTTHIISGHERAISCVCWLDNKHVVSAGEDKTIRLWDVSTGECLNIFNGHPGIITALQVDTNSTHVLSGSSDGMVRILNINTGTSYAVTQFLGTIHSITLDKLNLFALLVTPSGVSMIEIHNRFRYRAPYLFSLPESAVEIDQIARKYQRRIKRAKLALSKQHNVTSMQEMIQARSLNGYERDFNGFKYWSKLYLYFPKLKLKDVWKYTELNEHKKRITSLEFSPIDNKCYSASKDHCVYQWNIETQKVNQIFAKFEHPISVIKVSSDGQKILIACANNIIVMDIKSGQQLSLFCHHIGDVLAMTITADGDFVLSSDDKGMLLLWRIFTGELMADYSGKSGAVTTISVTPNGRFALTGHLNNNTISMWDLTTGEIISVFEEHKHIVTSITVTTNGRYFISASADASLRLWNIGDSRKKPLHVMQGHTKRVNQIAVDYQNKIVISSSDDKTVKIWDIITGQCLHTFEDAKAKYTSAVISMNGQYALSGDSNGKIITWCLDWFLSKKTYHEWDVDADIYLKNYVATHKTTEPHKELKGVIRILQYAGYGWLEKNDIGLKLVDFYQFNSKTILPGRKNTRLTINDKKKISNKKLLVYALLAGVLISGLLAMTRTEVNNVVQESIPQATENIDKNEQQTIEKMRDIAVLLAKKNSNAIIYKGKFIIRSLIVYKNINELQKKLHLNASDLIDSWGLPFKYKGVSVGAFQGRIMLRSAGSDQLFKTEDDLILNGFPHWDSLSVRKNQTVMIKLSTYKLHSNVDNNLTFEESESQDSDSQYREEQDTSAVDDIYVSA
ncbi:MAG: protein kinase [gamma proteobacterium symbiont of Bathyaustriella thionipta]|nr:protein kinase [gamma proteobacterium symbiont of Bathyaustriella thionipta]MCU7950864.1 protein kinase [gamma proteobacterium symbiont of Bathyaustriella thionipta]MCU7951822.1 protein kinase [gamma proteobacterium symbiont of Bathyaustriella thionipta]MCU7957369.1 protein kinase [gamma proteobacterium symbiont of Bathyaustriella thionipta]MCU7967293.1 protein kinase [gamma proteobacterium symbiont of Bathyaustriella thionipta]